MLVPQQIPNFTASARRAIEISQQNISRQSKKMVRPKKDTGSPYKQRRLSPTGSKEAGARYRQIYKNLKKRSMNGYEPSYWKSPYAQDIRALRWAPFIPKPQENKRKYSMLNKFQGVPFRKKLEIGNKFQQRAAFSYTDASNISGKLTPVPLDRISTIKAQNPDDHKAQSFSGN